MPERSGMSIEDIDLLQRARDAVRNEAEDDS